MRTALALRGHHQAPNIMIVDANAYTRKLVSDIMLQIGYGDVFVSRSGSEAEHALACKKPDMLVAAVDCGDMSGLDIARRMRFGEFSISPQTPVVMIAPGLCETQLQKIVQSGVDEVMIMPVSLSALRLRVEQAMFHRRKFVESRSYFGPCRRRSPASYDGPPRRLDDEVSRGSVADAEASILANIRGALSGLISEGWKVGETSFTAVDFYRLLSSHFPDVRKSGSKELDRIWKSASTYLQGIGAGAGQRDLDIIREHMQISCVLAGMRHSDHISLSDRIGELERLTRETIHKREH